MIYFFSSLALLIFGTPAVEFPAFPPIPVNLERSFALHSRTDQGTLRAYDALTGQVLMDEQEQGSVRLLSQ